MARLFALETPLPGAKPELKHLAETLVTAERPGDWAQALMDLGAMICTPSSPACLTCPVGADCQARKTGAPETYPRRDARPDRPQRYGAAYVLTSGDRVALVRRPAKGLLGGMLALPTSDWRAAPWSDTEAIAATPIAAAWKPVGEIRHVFTHFALDLRVFRAEGDWPDAIWTPRAGLEAMPSVFLKAAREALGA
jgi:A/G-specific adenine glycosylase